MMVGGSFLLLCISELSHLFLVRRLTTWAVLWHIQVRSLGASFLRGLSLTLQNLLFHCLKDFSARLLLHWHLEKPAAILLWVKKMESGEPRARASLVARGTLNGKSSVSTLRSWLVILVSVSFLIKDARIVCHRKLRPGSLLSTKRLSLRKSVASSGLNSWRSDDDPRCRRKGAPPRTSTASTERSSHVGDHSPLDMPTHRTRNGSWPQHLQAPQQWRRGQSGVAEARAKMLQKWNRHGTRFQQFQWVPAVKRCFDRICLDFLSPDIRGQSAYEPAAVKITVTRAAYALRESAVKSNPWLLIASKRLWTSCVHCPSCRQRRSMRVLWRQHRDTTAALAAYFLASRNATHVCSALSELRFSPLGTTGQR